MKQNKDVKSKGVIIGQIGAPYGVRGWVHLQSFMERPDSITEFSEWRVLRAENSASNSSTFKVEQIRPHSKGFVAKLATIEQREQAAQLTNFYIEISRELLPKLEDDYYWADLLQLEVFDTVTNAEIGMVTNILATGANDVLVVTALDGDKEYLIPYVLEQYILTVDLAQNRILVAWGQPPDSKK